MTSPWIEIEKYQDQNGPAVTGSSEYLWQARFACRVEVLPYGDWIKLKWGFNASALFDEFLERQKLFLESQYGVRRETGVESPDFRTLAFRFINYPGEGLLLAVLGKIHGRDEAEARESALSYYSEIKATFPYDYSLTPALSRDEFFHWSGRDLLDENNNQTSMVQIKRLEFPLYPGHNFPILQGLWQSGSRDHEQIWRSLAASPAPLLLNLSVRCTVLYEKERDHLSRSREVVMDTDDRLSNQTILPGMQQWNKSFVERRLAPWGKFFYLQVHLVSNQKLSENLFRTIGTSLTRNKASELYPGYRVISPRNDEVQDWRKKLRHLDLIFSGSFLPQQRLSEVADLEEVFAVMRLPYSPPENGLPDVHFTTTGHP